MSQACDLAGVAGLNGAHCLFLLVRPEWFLCTEAPSPGPCFELPVMSSCWNPHWSGGYGYRPHWTNIRKKYSICLWSNAPEHGLDDPGPWKNKSIPRYLFFFFNSYLFPCLVNLLALLTPIITVHSIRVIWWHQDLSGNPVWPTRFHLHIHIKAPHWRHVWVNSLKMNVINEKQL